MRDMTDSETGNVEYALYAARTGSAGHWPTVAGVLVDEIDRLRAELRDSAKHETIMHAAAAKLDAQASAHGEHTCGTSEDISAAAEILRAAADAIEDAPGWSAGEAARLREIAQVMEEESGDEERAIAGAMLYAARGY